MPRYSSIHVALLIGALGNLMGLWVLDLNHPYVHCATVYVSLSCDTLDTFPTQGSPAVCPLGWSWSQARLRLLGAADQRFSHGEAFTNAV